MSDHVAPEPAQRSRDAADGLLCRVAVGDSGAFEELFELTHPRVLGLATRVVGSRAAGEDVTQEVFVEVWRQAPRFRPDRGSAVAWITTIAHRWAVERVRSLVSAREREGRQAEQLVLEHGFIFDPMPDGGADDVPDIVGCLGVLTPLQRQAIDLIYFDGSTSREAADQLGVPTATMKTRLRDALQRLRHCTGGVA